MVAHEKLIEPHVTMKLLLAKPSSFSNLPAFKILMREESRAWGEFFFENFAEFSVLL